MLTWERRLGSLRGERACGCSPLSPPSPSSPPLLEPPRTPASHGTHAGRRRVLLKRFPPHPGQTVSSHPQSSSSVSDQELTGPPGARRTSFCTLRTPCAPILPSRAIQVPAPAAHIPPDDDFYVRDAHTGRDRPNVEYLRQHFFREGRLSHEQAMFILDQTTDLMSREPNMLQVPGPVIGMCCVYIVFCLCLTRPRDPAVCGDIHGQYVCPSFLLCFNLR